MPKKSKDKKRKKHKKDAIVKQVETQPFAIVGADEPDENGEDEEGKLVVAMVVGGRTVPLNPTIEDLKHLSFKDLEPVLEAKLRLAERMVKSSRGKRRALSESDAKLLREMLDAHRRRDRGEE